MPSKPAPRMVVVKRQEKEGKLEAFIRAGLAQAEGSDRLVRCDVVARSMMSPVVRSLAKVADEFGWDRLLIRLVLTPVSDPSRARQLPFNEVRIARRDRLNEAHEQLNIGSRTSWLGDCMRRDPSERDAFECYAPDCEVAAEQCQNAFGKLWSKSEAAPTKSSPSAGRDTLGSVASRGAVDGEVVAAGTGPTRH